MCASVVTSPLRDADTLKQQVALSRCRTRRAVGCIVICDADNGYLLCAAFSASGARRVMRDSLRGALERCDLDRCRGADLARTCLERAADELRVPHTEAERDGGNVITLQDVRDAVMSADVTAEALADAGVASAVRLWLTREEIDVLRHAGDSDETLDSSLREHMVGGVAETPVGCACALLETAGGTKTVAVAPIPASILGTTHTGRDWKEVEKMMRDRVTRTERCGGPNRVVAVQVSRVVDASSLWRQG